MQQFRIAVFPGDGIGHEVTAPAVVLLEKLAAHFGFRLALTWCEAGAELYRRTGEALPQRELDIADAADAILLGAMGLPGVRYPSVVEITPQIDLREKFGLYAGVRPLRILKGAPTPLADPRTAAVDAVLIRESTEGLFACRRMSRSEPDAVFDTMMVTRGVSERLFEFAFDLAASRSRRRGGRPARVTCIDKANVIPSMAFFR